MDTSFFFCIAFTFFAIFYFLVHIVLRIGLRKCDGTTNNNKPFVSVIVAARNEEKNITQVLNHLLNQSYEKYEIIVVNDRSFDKTAEIIQHYQSKTTKLKCINIKSIPKDMPAKKNALRAGIQSSIGEILCFTDADCLPPHTWLASIVQQFQPNVGLVAGYSPYKLSDSKSNLLLKFIEYEEFRAAIWSAGSIGVKLGWLCTGRNLAYRKEVYNQLNGFENIKHSISGDDDLFLLLVRKKTNWEIRYMLSKESFIPTIPPSSFKAFVEQRKRHFSAAKYFSIPMKIFFFIYHLANLLLLISPMLFILKYLSLNGLIVAVTGKLLSDSFLILSSSSIFDTNKYFKSFILMEVLYVIYNSLIGPFGIIGKFKWKN